MTTKLYFHAASNALSGTFPTGEQSSFVPTWSATGATTLRTMNTTIGVSQASLAGTTAASTSAQTGFFGFFCSPALSGAQSVGTGGSADFTIALSESNTNANLIINALNIYVWRPSTGAKVGTCIDFSTLTGGAEPSAASSEQVNSYTSAGGDQVTVSSVSAADGDVIICEIFAAQFAQAMATAYTATLFYDGTTENTTENAVVSNHAAFIQFAETLAFKGPAAVLTAAVGSFTLSGQAAGLKRGLKVTAAAASFTLSGQAATLTHGYRLVAAVGSFTRTGQAATLTATRKVIAAVGAFALSGQAAALNKGQRLTAAAGSFTLSGQDAGLKYGRKVTAAVGAFSLSGQTARLARSFSNLTAGLGAFALNGQAATLKRSFNALTAAVGGFALTGKDATLTKAGGSALSLVAGAGSFTLTGKDATLTSTAGAAAVQYYGGMPDRYSHLDPERVRRRVERDVRETKRLPKAKAKRKAREAYRLVAARPMPDSELVALLAPYGDRVSSALLPKPESIRFDRLVADTEALRRVYLAYYAAQEEEDIEILLLAS